jgi:hypothetical protein
VWCSRIVIMVSAYLNFSGVVVREVLVGGIKVTFIILMNYLIDCQTKMKKIMII